MTFRFELRRATQTAHDALDRFLDGAGFLDDAAGYQRFLRAQAVAHRAMEARLTALPATVVSPVLSTIDAVAPSPRRSALAAADSGLGRADLARLLAQAPTAPDIASTPALWGALYVIEGSALGARVIRKRLLERGVALDGRDRFLLGDWTSSDRTSGDRTLGDRTVGDRSDLTRWRSVTTGLDSHDWSAPDASAAIAAASDCFAWFRAVFGQRAHAAQDA